jgi:hypothetical protein
VNARFGQKQPKASCGSVNQLCGFVPAKRAVLADTKKQAQAIRRN